MKKLIILVLLLLTGCMNMQDTRQAKNKTTFELNVGYQEAYRLISSSLLQECDFVTGSIQPVIYIDAGFARINHVLEGNVGWSADFIDAGPGKTKMEFYTAFSAQLKFGRRMAAHVNGKVLGCYYDEIK